MEKINPISLREIFYQEKLRPLPNYLNLWAIENDAVIGVDLETSFIYEVSGANFLLMSEEQTNIFFEQIKNFLHALPQGITVQFLLQVRTGAEKKLKEYRQTVKTQQDFTDFIVHEKVEHFKKTNPFTRRLFLYITTYPQGTDLEKIKNPVFKFFVPNFKTLMAGVHEKRIEELNAIGDVFTTSLLSTGIKTHKLAKQEILGFLYSGLNPGRSEYLDPKELNNELTLRSQLVLNAADSQFSYLLIDGYYHRAVNMAARPQEISFMQIVDFSSQISGEFDLSFSLHTIDQEKILNSFAQKATAATIISTLNPFKRYHEAEIMAQHAKEIVEDTKNTFQKFYAISLWVVLRDTTLESLTQRTNKCVAEFRTMGDSEGIVDDMNHLFLFLALLPNHTLLNQRKQIMQTEAVAQMTLFFQEWRGSKEAKMLFLTREQELLPVDLFDSELPAKHGLVLGTTGSGKSFATNFILTNFYIESDNNNIIIIDIGGSYKKLCSLFKGEYFEVELSDKYAFNPFPSKEVAVISKEPFEVDPDVITYLKLLTQKLLNKASLTGEESMILEQAIIHTYQYAKEETPLLQSLYYQLENFAIDGKSKNLDTDSQAIAKTFAKNLTLWTNGSYSKILNRPTTLNPQSRMIVFDLQKLQEHKVLMPIMFFLLQNVISSKLYNKTLRKIIVFDESWKFFNDPISAELIENLYRTARKFNAAVYSISQSPDDFLQSAASSSVLGNSYVKYILQLQKGHENLEKFGLNAQETEIVKSLSSVRKKYSEVFLKFNQQTRVLRIQPSATDYWICTTDPEDEQTQNRLLKENPGINQIDLLKKLKGEL